MSQSAAWEARRIVSTILQSTQVSRGYGNALLLAHSSHPQRPRNLRTPQHRLFHRSPCFKQGVPGLTVNSGLLEKFKNSLEFPACTHSLDELSSIIGSENEEKRVTLHGYLGSRRDLSKRLSFATLHDPKYDLQVQVVSSSSSAAQKTQDVHRRLKSLSAHTPVALEGILKPKPENDRKNKTSIVQTLPLEDFEITLENIHILNDVPPEIIITPETEFPPEQRHLQLRTDGHTNKALALRSIAKSMCGNLLEGKYGFTEVETPLLFKSTSEGAREFIVPTRKRGLAYALPQSPQQYKQILMASGIRDYYQFAKCFRDEDLRADRQPEFTQLDIERSFATGDSIIALITVLIKTLWKELLNIELPDLFPRLEYESAMLTYGSDKPDLRNPVSKITPIQNLLPADLINMITPIKSPVVEAIVLQMEHQPSDVRRFIADFLDSVEGKTFLDNPNGSPGVFVCDSSKPLNGLSAFGFQAVEWLEQDLDLENGNLVILQARVDESLRGGSTRFGDLRTAIWKAAVKERLIEPPSWEKFEPLWITDFPLFTPSNSSEPGQGGNAGLASTHHPFTSPKTVTDVDLLLTEPEKVIGDHYDLVINGEEIGGGSRRIHQAEMQEFIFRDVLKMDEERIAEFAHLLEALRSGCPPHAGIALGFDRLVAMIHSSRIRKKTSLRDVIAFPKSGKGEDLMVKTPGRVSQEVLKTYHLNLRD